MAHIGDLTVGIQLGGLNVFLNGWKAATAAVSKAALGMARKLNELVMAQARAGDELQKMAQRVEWSTEALSEMDVALQLSGTSLIEFEVGMRGMLRTVRDAREGLSTASDGLQKLGVSTRDLKDLRPEQIFDKVIQGLRDIEDPAERAGQAMRTFGRAGMTLLPLVNSNIDAARGLAQQMGNIWTQEEADLAALVIDTLTLAKTAFQGLGKTIAIELMPYFARFLAGVAVLVPKFNEWAKANNAVGETLSFVNKNWRVFVENVIAAAETVPSTVIDLLLAFDKLGEYIGRGVGRVYVNLVTMSKEVQLSILDTFKGLAESLNEATGTGTAGNALLKRLGLDPNSFINLRNRLELESIELERQLDGIAERIANRDVGSDRSGDSTGLRTLLENLRMQIPELANGVSEGVQFAVDKLAEMSPEIDAILDKLSKGWKKTHDQMGKKAATTFKGIRKIQGGYRDFAVSTFIDILKGAAGSFSEILKEALSSLGAMAIEEGVMHVLAGQAKVASGITAAAGRREIAAGKRMIGWGAAAVALGSAVSGGGSGDSGGGDGGADDSGGFDRDGPGYDLPEEQEQRPGLTINVQGDMLDSRETWLRITELSREHSDHDITIVSEAVA